MGGDQTTLTPLVKGEPGETQPIEGLGASKIVQVMRGGCHIAIGCLGSTGMWDLEYFCRVNEDKSGTPVAIDVHPLLPLLLISTKTVRNCNFNS